MGVLVDSLQLAADFAGMRLTRREFRRGGLVERILYAIQAPGEEQAREEQAREEQVICYVTLRKMEGQSTACEAYVKLSKLKTKFDQILSRR